MEETDKFDTNADTKQKILKALQPKKKYKVSWAETIWYDKEVEAVDKKEVEDMFYDGGIDFEEKDIVDGEGVDDSFEVTEC